MIKTNDNSIIVSSETADWSRESKAAFEWIPSRSLLASIRDYQHFSASSNIFTRIVLRKIAILRHRFWSVVTGADIPVNCRFAQLIEWLWVELLPICSQHLTVLPIETGEYLLMICLQGQQTE